ncbi:DUF6712 family protein [Hymenobacter pini]|uniref:DUF6712 family protein n=1 Tax=Hymenobacter pini TaxID=2880879 RepID=UPI001CF55E0D|nr:hypothetical protein [Hymenobacter pini]MCA8830278.1 hypothetical protein [Hymenobacter pini]
MELEPLLLSAADCLPYADLPATFREARIDAHIRRAQRRLKPILGPELYAELLRLTQAGPLPQVWAELRARLVPALANATLAAYWPFSQTSVTGASVVRKTSQYSEPIDARTLATQAAVFDGEALSHEIELRSWLIANAADYQPFYPTADHCAGGATASRTPTTVVQRIRPLPR